MCACSWALWTFAGQYHAYGTTNEGITVDDYFLLWESADGFTVTGRHVAGLVYQEPCVLLHTLPPRGWLPSPNAKSQAPCVLSSSALP